MLTGSCNVFLVLRWGLVVVGGYGILDIDSHVILLHNVFKFKYSLLFWLLVVTAPCSLISYWVRRCCGATKR